MPSERVPFDPLILPVPSLVSGTPPIARSPDDEPITAFLAPAPAKSPVQLPMSTKLSPALKAVLKASHARGSAVAAPAGAHALFEAIRSSAASNGIGHATWLTLSVRPRPRLPAQNTADNGAVDRRRRW